MVHARKEEKEEEEFYSLPYALMRCTGFGVSTAPTFLPS